ncbi:MAG: acyl-CoA dehydrogenase family protein [Acidimicrobiales bacterium]
MSEDYLGVPLGREDVLFLAEIQSFLTESLESFFFDGTISRLEAQRAWQDTLHRANLAAISWPIEYGGRAATPVQQLLFATEIAKSRAPEPINRSAINQLGPTIIQWGTAEQRARLLPRILSGEDVWCQGFSEPDAGSDLASLQTSARLDGDSLVVNGTKVWTS